MLKCVSVVLRLCSPLIVERSQESIRQIKNDLADHDREFDEASQQIDGERAKTQDQDTRVAAAQAEIDRLEAVQEELKDQISSVDEAIADLQSQGGDEENPNLERINTLQRDLHRTKQTLQQARDAVKDPVAVFGTNMRRLLNAIEDARQRGQLTDTVDGPIGAYIQVERRWQKVVETMLGSSLTAFVVLNVRDQKTLMDMTKRLGM